MNRINKRTSSTTRLFSFCVLYNICLRLVVGFRRRSFFFGKRKNISVRYAGMLLFHICQL